MNAQLIKLTAATSSIAAQDDDSGIHSTESKQADQVLKR